MNVPDYPPGIYGVIVHVKLSPDQRMTEMAVSRIYAVTGDASGQVSAPLPPVFLKNMQARLAKVKFSETEEAYRFFVFNPQQPDRIDLGPPPEKQ